MEGYETTEVVILPDGGYGWVIMITSFFSNFVVDGTISSSGQFMLPFTEDMQCSTASASLVGSLFVGVSQLAGPLASGVANRYGFRVAIIVGGAIAAAGFTVSYLATSIEYLYVSYGIVGGLGLGLIYVPSALAVNFWFTRWRALATGIALTGYNTGGVVLPLVIEMSISRYGWRETFLVQAALMLSCSLIGLLFRPPPTTAIIQSGSAAGASLTSVGYSLTSRMHVGLHNKNYMSVLDMMGPAESTRTLGSTNWGPYGMESQILGQRPSAKVECAECCRGFITCRWKLCCLEFGRCLSTTICCCCSRRSRYRKIGARPFYRDDIFFGGSTVRLQQYQNRGEYGEELYNLKVTRVASQRDILEELSARCVLFPHALRRTLATMCDVTLLRSPAMALQTTSCLAFAAAFYTPFIFLPARAISAGLSPFDATFYVTAISSAAAVGRLSCAVVASLPFVNHFYLQSLWQTLGGLAVLACGFPIEYSVQLACCAVYGMTIAFNSNLRSLIIVDLVGLQNLTNAFGLVMLLQGVGYIVGPPIAGMILEAVDNDYDVVFWYAGALILFSAVCTYPLNELRKRGDSHDIFRAPKNQ